MIADGMLRPARTVKNQTTLLALMALAVLYGFSRSYYFKLAFGTPSLSPLYHLHGVLFTSWLLLLILQTSLVAAGRTPLHRRLGVAGGVLAAAMAIVAIPMSRVAGARTPGDPMSLAFLAVPLATVIVFPASSGWRCGGAGSRKCTSA
jgi:hypothetical protein